ncbi:DNA replication/repair protein RecF [Microcella humidisoli]|uniref:DNA replication and repair protein RecF n=1 Tax=Microcella humidisoli TaxID=2963406 RepID=A0ABY5FYX1_9MICO|nr:DNA replication/repair protein RecF [Microcella humidisoli]UTT63494.1 DNA replication/repair protein RecF [Microcella humidisoli]
MHVTHLSLADFRNYARADVALRPGAVLFVGRNGQGKTNLVEAIAYAGSASSHRVSSDQALIRFGAESGIVRLRVQHEERAAVIEIELNRASPNRAQVNGSGVRLRDLPRYFASVVFAPEDLALVRGDPGVRRGFLDTLVVQRAPRFAGVIADYERVVRQRNSLLKSARASRLPADSLTTLDVWDERLVSLGTELIMARADLVEALRPHVARAYSAVAGDDHRTRMALRLSVDDSDDESSPPEIIADPAIVAERFRARLADRRRAELDRAVTLVGPHRDDLVLELNGLPARGYASHGESWSYALALKLASAEVLRAEAIAGDPVLILDDVFAELDEGRRERLADAVGGFEQVLITAAVGGDVPERLAATRIGIAAGAIVEEAE